MATATGTATATATGTATATAVPMATGTRRPTGTARPTGTRRSTATRTTPPTRGATGTAISPIGHRHPPREATDGDATVPRAPARVPAVFAAGDRGGGDRRGRRHPPLAVDHDGAQGPALRARLRRVLRRARGGRDELLHRGAAHRAGGDGRS